MNHVGSPIQNWHKGLTQKGKAAVRFSTTETVPEEDARLSPSGMVVVPSRQDSPLVARFFSVGSVFFFFFLFFCVGSLFN